MTHFFCENFFDMFHCLIVHYVKFWFEPFSCEFLKITFVCIVDASVVQAGDWGGQNGAWFMHVHEEVANTSIEQNKREINL